MWACLLIEVIQAQCSDSYNATTDSTEGGKITVSLHQNFLNDSILFFIYLKYYACFSVQTQLMLVADPEKNDLQRKLLEGDKRSENHTGVPDLTPSFSCGILVILS